MTPEIIQIMFSMNSVIFTGKQSPYPTVVKVWKAQYIE
jgi:hypothetical protein